MSVNIFNSVKGLHPRRNSFSAHTYRNDFTSTLGLNIPVYVQHVPPATRVKVSTSALIRLQALTAPIMDNIDFYVHFWQLPYRLIENDRFTQFISGEIDPEEYTGVFGTPKKLATYIAEGCVKYGEKANENYLKIVGNGSLLDFLGYDIGLFPTGFDIEDDQVVMDDNGNDWKDFNFRGVIAYYMLHVNWYMNENVPYFQSFVEIAESLQKDYGDDALEKLAELLVRTFDSFGTTLLPHAWEKDYFTSALPNVQFGSPVTLPIAGTAPVNVPAQTILINPAQSPAELSYIQFGFNSDVTGDKSLLTYPILGDKAKLIENTSGAVVDQILGQLEGNTQSKALVASADLSEATAITINELRFANALQVFKERQMRYGRRRLEHYKGFFDVTPEDLRLQVPKYLGGGRIPINIADIEQTSSSDANGALGHLAGKATAVAGGFAGFTTFCSEETILIGIAFAMPHISYGQNVSRFLFKTNDIYDYFNPSFEHLGEQEIDKLEVFSASSGESVFGYTPRYTEYRFHNNEMHGEFKNSLAYWNLGRLFATRPALNANFIYMQPSVFDRIFAVQSTAGQSAMLASMLFRQRIIQPVSKYGTPMLLA